MAENFNRSSYLEARKPIIRRCRKFIPLKKKELNTSFEMEKSSKEECQKVYLRIKPFVSFSSNTFTIQSSSTLTAQLHENSIKHHYKFTKIFSQTTTQNELFHETCLEPLQKFISGEVCLLFAYGASNAGKTHTIQGNIQQPGIIPQALNLIFSTLEGRLRNDCKFKPHQVNSVQELNYLSRTDELHFRDTILDYVFETPSINRLKNDKIYYPSFQEMKSHLEEVINLDHKMEVEYYLWVSFFEIHDECIYDLLEQSAADGKRKNLSLITADGGSYVKDLKQVCVTSADDAFHVYMFGMNNLKTAFTTLNYVSSRSHSIFSLKMICLDSSTKTASPRVGVFSCVDLAGTERAKKSNNEGLHLKEYQNINNSLLVLGRCLTAIRHNQGSKDKMVVPYRDSKLTRVFQHALSVQQSVTMIVNVNFDPKMNKESLNALKFSAIAREIVVAPIKIGFDSTFAQRSSKPCCEHLKEISDLKHLLEAEEKKSKHLEHEFSNRLQPHGTNNVLELEKYKNFYRNLAINFEIENKKLKSLMSEVSKENGELKVQLGVLIRKLGVYEVSSSNSNGNESKLKELHSELEDKDKKIDQISKELGVPCSNCDVLESNTVILENELKTMDRVVRECCEIYIDSEDSDSESIDSDESEDDYCGESDRETKSPHKSIEIIDLVDSY